MIAIVAEIDSQAGHIYIYCNNIIFSKPKQFKKQFTWFEHYSVFITQTRNFKKFDTKYGNSTTGERKDLLAQLFRCY